MRPLVRERLAAVAIVGLAAGFRVWRFDDLPGGLLLDEAFNGVDVLEVLDGARPAFFSSNFGREPLFIYSQALAVGAFGPTPIALRTVALVFGLLAVPATHAATRRLAGGTVALIAAAWVATAPWSVIFSRVGLRAIALPALVAIAFYLFHRAITARRERAALRRRRVWARARRRDLNLHLRTPDAARPGCLGRHAAPQASVAAATRRTGGGGGARLGHRRAGTPGELLRSPLGRLPRACQRRLRLQPRAERWQRSQCALALYHPDYRRLPRPG